MRENMDQNTSQSTAENDVARLKKDLLDLVDSYLPIEHGRQVDVADAFYCYRLLLGRMPSKEVELHNLLAHQGVTYRQFLNNLLDSPEFSKQPGFMPGGHLFMAELERFRFWFRTGDREMGARMAIGQYEPEVLALLPKLVRPGQSCLDVGAQTGFYSMHLASIVGAPGRVYSFEPLQASFEVIEKNILENDFGGIVTAFNMACSDREGVLPFVEASGMLIAASTEEAATKSIRTVRVDDVVPGPIAFVKLDVEGHEPAALAGMSGMLDTDRPFMLTEVNEYWLRKAGSSALEYMKALQHHRYVLRRAEDGRLIEPDAMAETMGELDSLNIVALPAEKDHASTTIWY
jgi:FkbM family methyltransferase